MLKRLKQYYILVLLAAVMGAASLLTVLVMQGRSSDEGDTPVPTRIAQPEQDTSIPSATEISAALPAEPEQGGETLPEAAEAGNLTDATDGAEGETAQPGAEAAIENTAPELPTEPEAAAPTPTPAPREQASVTLPPPVQPAPDRLVVNFSAEASAEEVAAYVEQVEALGGTVTAVDKLNSVVVEVPQTVTADQLPKSDFLLGSEPDYYVVAQQDSVNDTLFSEQWALPVMGVSQGWGQLPASPASVTIAVIDSGVCESHPELAGRIVAGWDFVEGDDIPQDEFGHGCAVAGLIAANTNNGEGIAGVAPNARIMPLRVLNGQGIGLYSNLANGIVWAVDQGATVINLSLGGLNPSTLLENAVAYAHSKNVLVIAAAGNNGTSRALYPAAYPTVVAVGSVDDTLQPSVFSNYGTDIDLWAPGASIRTLGLDNGYVTLSGTSFAAPHVAGVAALEIAMGRTLRVSGGLVYFSAAEVVGLPPTPDTGTGATPTPAPDDPTQPSEVLIQARMANPGAVYCTTLGYSYVVDANGMGTCVFPDGQTCPDWDFLEGTCGESFSFCAQQGYGQAVVSDGLNALSQTYAVCVDSEGNRIDSVDNLMALSSAALASGCAMPQSYLNPLEAFEAQAAPTTSSVADGVIASLALPASFDWRTYRGIDWLTPVRNQGQCGACWAFGAVSAVEGVLNIANNNPNLDLNLSEQALISGCSGANAGSCCGGWHGTALTHIRDEGVPLETAFNYVDANCSCGPNGCTCTNNTNDQCTNGTCPVNLGTLYNIDATEQLINPSDTVLKQNILGRGPVVVGMRIGMPGDGFQSGIYRCTNDRDINYAVTLVGWNDAERTWLARGSWGTGYGDGGYFKIGYGECGVNLYAYYVEVEQTPPSAPTLQAPAEGGGSITGQVLMSWSQVFDGGTQVYFDLQVATNNTFTTLVRDETGIAQAATNTYNTTLANGTYFWRVRAVRTNGFPGQWSSVRSFNVNTTTPSAVTLVSPANGVEQATTRPQFRWNAGNSDRYEIQIGTNNPPQTSFFSNTTTFTAPDLVVGETYYWRVRSNNSAGNFAAWSEIRSFTVVSATTTTPQRNYFTTNTAILTWNPVSWAASYEVQVDNNNTFTSPEYSTVVGSNTLTATTTALQNGTYFWRVRAQRSNGTWGGWSTSETFIIAVLIGNNAPADALAAQPSRPAATPYMATSLMLAGSLLTYWAWRKRRI